jgi:hypothetical protein
MELRTDNRAGILGTYNNVFEYERWLDLATDMASPDYVRLEFDYIWHKNNGLFENKKMHASIFHKIYQHTSEPFQQQKEIFGWRWDIPPRIKAGALHFCYPFAFDKNGLVPIDWFINRYTRNDFAKSHYYLMEYWNPVVRFIGVDDKFYHNMVGRNTLVPVKYWTLWEWFNFYHFKSTAWDIRWLIRRVATDSFLHALVDYLAAMNSMVYNEMEWDSYRDLYLWSFDFFEDKKDDAGSFHPWFDKDYKGLYSEAWFWFYKQQPYCSKSYNFVTFGTYTNLPKFTPYLQHGFLCVYDGKGWYWAVKAFFALQYFLIFMCTKYMHYKTS